MSSPFCCTAQVPPPRGSLSTTWSPFETKARRVAVIGTDWSGISVPLAEPHCLHADPPDHAASSQPPATMGAAAVPAWPVTRDVGPPPASGTRRRPPAYAINTFSPVVAACWSTGPSVAEIRLVRLVVPLSVRRVRLTESSNAQWPATELIVTFALAPPMLTLLVWATVSECAASMRYTCRASAEYTKSMPSGVMLVTELAPRLSVGCDSVLKLASSENGMIQSSPVPPEPMTTFSPASMSSGS